MSDFQAGAESTFDRDEPVGEPTDTFPGRRHEYSGFIVERCAACSRRCNHAHSDRSLLQASRTRILRERSVLAALRHRRCINQLDQAHHPEFLGSWEWVTFGRIRSVHLNTVVYGWSSMVGIGSLLWLQARLCKVRLPNRIVLPSTVMIWNLA
jgi:hypothetical protein